MDVDTARIEQSVKSAHHRIDKLEEDVKDIRKLTEAVLVTSEKVDNLKEDVTEIKDKVEVITARPGKWWDKLISAGLGAIAAGLIAAVLALILK